MSSVHGLESVPDLCRWCLGVQISHQLSPARLLLCGNRLSEQALRFVVSTGEIFVLRVGTDTVEGSVQVRFGVRTLSVSPGFAGFFSGESDTLLRGSTNGRSGVLPLLI